MGPRIVTVFFIQIIFLSRDNLASRLAEGSVTALTYGYFIMQVPETLIGTAIATALLPTLSTLIAEEKKMEFTQLMNRAVNIVFALSILISALISVSLPYLIEPIFGFKAGETEILVWVTRAYLVGLLGQCLLEVVTRAFYAQKNTHIPFIATAIRTILFIPLAMLLIQPFNAAGLALADSITIGVEVLILIIILKKDIPQFLQANGTLLRVSGGSLASIGLIYLLLTYSPFPHLFTILIGLIFGSGVGLFFIKKELKFCLLSIDLYHSI
jgi:putative peptidoglycan lipid II flippase